MRFPKRLQRAKTMPKKNTKKDLLDIITSIKFELSYVNVLTTKPPNRRPLANLEVTIGRLKKTTEDTTKKRKEMGTSR